MLGGADNPNGELLSYIIGADMGRLHVAEPVFGYVQERRLPQYFSWSVTP